MWRALELKTYPKENAAIEQLTVTDYLEEKVPVIIALNVPPPPAAPEVIEIVEDVAEIEETVIRSTEINQETIVEEAPLKVEDIAVVEEEEDIEVPFA